MSLLSGHITLVCLASLQIPQDKIRNNNKKYLCVTLLQLYILTVISLMA